MSTIVLIHGAWMNPACFADWAERFEAAGHNCLAPAWPHMDGPVAELRANPPAELAEVGVGEIADRYTEAVEALDEAPILIGHSFGGLIVQLLLNRGLGAVGVAVHPAPPRGVLPTPGAFSANLPVLTKWSGWKRVLTLSEKDFANTFANGLDPADAPAAYDKYVVPTPGRPFFQAAFAPFSSVTAVDWSKPDRAPLLITGGGLDRTVPVAMNRANHKKYKSGKVEFRFYEDRSHFTIAEPGWESVADDALDWALQATA